MITTRFNLTNSTGQLLYTSLEISPDVSPISYSGSIVDSTTIKVIDNKSDNISIRLVPNYYNILLSGFNGGTRFKIYLPNTIDGEMVDASDYIM